MYLIDTNVLSDAYRRLEPPSRWLAQIDPDLAFVSVVTIGEIARGIAMKRKKNVSDAALLEKWLEALRRGYADRLLPIDEAVAVAWGEISAVRTRGVPNALIAATAFVNRLTLVTRNTKDFADTGIALINPWDA
jgi:predicted nucleic acid-binding protein